MYSTVYRYTACSEHFNFFVTVRTDLAGSFWFPSDCIFIGWQTSSVGRYSDCSRFLLERCHCHLLKKDMATVIHFAKWFKASQCWNRILQRWASSKKNTCVYFFLAFASWFVPFDRFKQFFDFRGKLALCHGHRTNFGFLRTRFRGKERGLHWGRFFRAVES